MLGRMLGWLDLNMAGHYRNIREQHTQRAKPEDWLLTWVIGGRGFMQFQGRKHTIEGDTLFLLPPGLPHEYRAEPNDPWEVLWVHFSGKSAASFAEKLMPKGQWRRRFELDDLILQRWDEMVIAYEDPRRREGMLPSALLVGLLGLLVDRLQPRDAEERRPFDVDRLQSYIHQHLAEPMTLRDLARQAGLSVPYFSRSFRKLFAVSPSQYLIRQRVGRAAVLLKNTSMKLEAIAQAVGYEDAYYLSRIFKKITGVPPAAYRDPRQTEKMKPA